MAEYSWSDASAVWTWQYANGEPSERHSSARAYLFARLEGDDAETANEKANNLEES